MVDCDIRYEALSALLGSPVKPVDVLPNKTTRPVMTPDDLLIAAILGNETLIRKLAFELRNQTNKSSVVVESDSLELNDDESENLEDLSDSLSRVLDKISNFENEFFIDESDFFDPPYDHDFTDLSTSEPCKRGEETYERPYGWYRMALKVKDKYPDGNTWLGPCGWRSESAPGEWPVSYHGTSIEGAKGIIRSHYKAGSRHLYGRGIYSTPKLSVAISPLYSKTFQSPKNGKTYRVVMQNRINPEERQICKEEEDYWLIPVPKGTSTVKKRKIVERSIRPYGILLQEMKEDKDEKNRDSSDSDSNESDEDSDQSDTDSNKSDKDSDQRDSDSNESDKDSDQRDSDSNESDKDSDQRDSDSTESDKDSDQRDTDSNESDKDSDQRDTDSNESDKDSDQRDTDLNESDKDSDQRDSDSNESDKDSDQNDSDSNESDKDSDQSDSDSDENDNYSGQKKIKSCSIS